MANLDWLTIAQAASYTGQPKERVACSGLPCIVPLNNLNERLYAREDLRRHFRITQRQDAEWRLKQLN